MACTAKWDHVNSASLQYVFLALICRCGWLYRRPFNERFGRLNQPVNISKVHMKRAFEVRMCIHEPTAIIKQ